MLWECAVHLEGFEIWGGGGGPTEWIMGDFKMEHSPFSRDVTSALMESVNNKKTAFRPSWCPNSSPVGVEIRSYLDACIF